MKRAIVLGMVSVGLLCGCSHYTVYEPARPGQVYVVRHTPVGNEYVYNCEANGGNPICWRVEEIPLSK